MAYNFSTLKESFQKIEEWLKNEYFGIQTGRANPALLDSIFVEVYGTRQPIKNVASVNVEDARTLRIAPWDKSQVKDIEKAIVDSNLGLSVASDGMGVRAIFPMLTEESRGRLVKVIKAKLEEARISVRKEREEAMSIIEADKKSGAVGEDETIRLKESVQIHVDEINEKLHELAEKKEVDVMKV
jgi:ribosome recycling factor